MKKNDTHNNAPDLALAGSANLNDSEAERKAMLYLLEDLDETTETVSKGKKEWETTFDAIPDAIVIHDRYFKIVRCNSAYGRAANMDFNNMIGKPYYQIFPKTGEPLKQCRGFVSEKTAPDEQRHWSDELAYGNKFYKITEFRLQLNSETINYVHIIEDITEKKADEEAIKESEYRYRMLYDNLNDAAFLADSDTGLIIESNKPAEILLGRPMQEIIGMHFSKLHPAEKIAEYSKHFTTHVEKGRVADYEGEALRKDGKTVPVYISAHPLIIGGKRLIFGIFRDLTLQKEAEKEIAREAELTKHLLMIANAATSTADIDKFIGQTAACVKIITKCDSVLAYLYDETASVFRPCRAEGIEDKLTPFFMTEVIEVKSSFIKQAALNNGLFLAKVDNEAGRPLNDHLKWLKNTDCVAVLPIRSREDYLGLFMCVQYRANQHAKTPVTERTELLLRGIAQQISAPLAEAKLYKQATEKSIELSRKIETIQVMHNIDKSILSSLKPQEIIETVVMFIHQLVACDRAAVHIADKNKGGFLVKAGFGLKGMKAGDFIPFAETSLTDTLDSGRMNYIPNLRDAVTLLPFEKGILNDGFSSLLRIPFKVKDGDLNGILHVGAYRPAAFTSDDLTALSNLSLQISVALEHTKLLEDLEDLFISTIRALSNAVDAKSPWTMGHSERVTAYALRTAQIMGINKKELKNLEIAGLLHDIGKLSTYESILNKPGKLTEEELVIIKQHPSKGADILAPLKQLKDIIPAVKYHHEFYDGTGYPEGLKGENIPLLARLLKVADTVDAMAADRPYRKGKSFDDITAELKKFSGIQFDPDIVVAFLKANNGIHTGPVQLSDDIGLV